MTDRELTRNMSIDFSNDFTVLKKAVTETKVDQDLDSPSADTSLSRKVKRSLSEVQLALEVPSPSVLIKVRINQQACILLGAYRSNKSSTNHQPFFSGNEFRTKFNGVNSTL